MVIFFCDADQLDVPVRELFIKGIQFIRLLQEIEKGVGEAGQVRQTLKHAVENDKVRKPVIGQSAGGVVFLKILFPVNGVQIRPDDLFPPVFNVGEPSGARPYHGSSAGFFKFPVDAEPVNASVGPGGGVGHDVGAEGVVVPELIGQPQGLFIFQHADHILFGSDGGVQLRDFHGRHAVDAGDLIGTHAVQFFFFKFHNVLPSAAERRPGDRQR